MENVTRGMMRTLALWLAMLVAHVARCMELPLPPERVLYAIRIAPERYI